MSTQTKPAERIVQLLEEIRDELRNGSLQEVYECEKCGKVFDSAYSLNGHIGAAHSGRDKEDWKEEYGIDSDNFPGRDMTCLTLKLIDQIPSDRVTSPMVKPHLDEPNTAEPTLHKLFKHGVVGRDGKGGRAEPYGYYLVEKGERILADCEEEEIDR